MQSWYALMSKTGGRKGLASFPGGEPGNEAWKGLGMRLSKAAIFTAYFCGHGFHSGLGCLAVLYIEQEEEDGALHPSHGEVQE